MEYSNPRLSLGLLDSLRFREANGISNARRVNDIHGGNDGFDYDVDDSSFPGSLTDLLQLCADGQALVPKDCRVFVGLHY